MIDVAGVNRIADERADFTVLACVPVALPYWRLRLRLELLAVRPISPLELFTMRACREASPRLADMRQLLGLDEGTFARVVASVIANGWAVSRGTNVLALTQQGAEVVEAGTRERTETRVISVEYDGLLRKPVLLNVPLEPQQRKSLGLRELPAQPGTAPDLIELQDSFGELQALIRRSGDGRDQDVELLAVKGILRRERLYREGMLVIMRSAAGEIQAAPLIDGVVSDAHEQRLAAPEVARRIRIRGELRRGRQRGTILPEPLRKRFDEVKDSDAYALRRAARNAAASGDATAAEVADRAQFATRALPVRGLAPQEHLQVLNTTLRSVQTHLILMVVAVTAASADREFLTQLESCVKRGVMVTLIHESEHPLPPSLATAASEWKGLRVAGTRGLGRSILVRDDDLALVTLFPLLAAVGRERRFRDERGWLIQRPENVSFVLREIAEILTRAGLGDLRDAVIKAPCGRMGDPPRGTDAGS